MAQRRALIIGGSMSGLLVALMLRRRGWQADIYERVAGELAGRGAGIVAQPTLIAHLDALGLDTGELGVPIARRQMLDREGRIAVTGDCPQIFTAWERVYRVLRDDAGAAAGELARHPLVDIGLPAAPQQHQCG